MWHDACSWWIQWRVRKLSLYPSVHFCLGLKFSKIKRWDLKKIRVRLSYQGQCPGWREGTEKAGKPGGGGLALVSLGETDILSTQNQKGEWECGGSARQIRQPERGLLPWWSSVQNKALPMQGAWVLSIVGEPRCHIPCSVVQKKKKARERCSQDPLFLETGLKKRAPRDLKTLTEKEKPQRQCRPEQYPWSKGQYSGK